MNISLTDEQAKFVGAMTGRMGFANRSEFLRALLRRAQTDTKFSQEAQTWPFAPPATQSRSKILATLSGTGKYSDDFLADLREGLEQSDYFDK